MIERFKAVFPMFTFLLDEGFELVEFQEGLGFGGRIAYLRSDKFFIGISAGRGEGGVSLSPIKKRGKSVGPLDYRSLLIVIDYISGSISHVKKFNNEWPQFRDSISQSEEFALNYNSRVLQENLSEISDFLENISCTKYKKVLSDFIKNTIW